MSVIWEIILRDSWEAILRLTAARMRMPELENLNPHLFEASDHAIYRVVERALRRDPTDGHAY
jgi:hypothetical protein